MVYSIAEEELIDFLNICKPKDPKVMIFPSCSVVFNKDDVQELEKDMHYNYHARRFGKQKKQGKFVFDNRGSLIKYNKAGLMSHPPTFPWADGLDLQEK